MTHEAADTEAPDDVELTEERMRRALGLGEPGAQRTLTLKAGLSRQVSSRAAMPSPSAQQTSVADKAASRASTPSPLYQRVAELEQQLTTERQRHDEARRRLRQAQDAVQVLEARLQHDAAVHQDKLDAERQAIIRAQRALDNVVFEVQLHADARRSFVTSTQAADRSAAESRAVAAATRSTSIAKNPPAPSTDPALPKKLGRPRTRPLPEPKPVRWWTPSYKTKGKS